MEALVLALPGRGSVEVVTGSAEEVSTSEVVTDGVKTPEEVTPWEGELMSPAMRSSLSFNLAALNFYLGLHWV